MAITHRPVVTKARQPGYNALSDPAVLILYQHCLPIARQNEHGWVQFYNFYGDLTPMLPIEWQRAWYTAWCCETPLRGLTRRFEELVWTAGATHTTRFGA